MLLVPKLNDFKLFKKKQLPSPPTSDNETTVDFNVGDHVYSSHSSETYKIIKFLGQGQFSTVWLVKKISTQETFAMKITKPGYNDIALDELQFFNLLHQHHHNDEFQGHQGVVKVYDHLLIHKTNQFCLIMELMDVNLLEVLPKLKKNLPIIKSITLQLLSSLAYIHSHGIIHTDLKLENILVGSNSKIVKIADLGNATLHLHHLTNHIQTRQYRSPEVILGHVWDYKVDIWSLGCLIFELITGDYLFDPQHGDSFTKDEDHLAQIVELLGAFPTNEYLSGCSRRYEFFDESNKFKTIKHLKFWTLENVLLEKYGINDKLLCDFLLCCLNINIEERFNAGSLIHHPWLKFC